MHGSRVYKLFGMGNGCRENSCFVSISSGSRVYNHYHFFTYTDVKKKRFIENVANIAFVRNRDFSYFWFPSHVIAYKNFVLGAKFTQKLCGIFRMHPVPKVLMFIAVQFHLKP